MNELPANILTPENNDEYVAWALKQRGGLQLMADRMAYFQDHAAQLQDDFDTLHAAFEETTAHCLTALQERDDYKRRMDEYANNLIEDANVIIRLRAELEQAQRDLTEYRTEIERLTRKVMTA